MCRCDDWGRGLVVFVISVFLMGCTDVPQDSSSAQEPPAAADQDEPAGLSVKLPGVEVNLSEGDGLQVTTPGTDVHLSAEDGLQVTAPGTDVSVNDDGVNVSAPNAEVHSTSQEPAEESAADPDQ